MTDYIVKSGDCLSSIALKHGYSWETIWNHSKNANLRSKRKDPNVLFPGDSVFIPDMMSKSESGQTENRHRFRKKGTPGRLRLRILDENQEPLTNAQYSLDIDGKLTTGQLDAQGMLDETIPPDAKKGMLIIGTHPDTITYKLDLGHLDPIDTLRGVQSRLDAMGFYTGPLDGTLNEQTQSAIRSFQEKYQLPVDGKPNSQTEQKLQEVYGR